ncbi:peptidoglycan-binding domain-containing protein [Afifella sp. IM 167]|uniref:peptidoglycan-binding domain-containing protein n=1 Tax=Afifella sp. IM 167 TaxID=2033586 RepID=UPI001CCB77DA|nr:peptidoglycan-binding domain-containing protein [Afifella sp. IM 167]MBZ8133099.1 hypothetical protein [Afifella sp. IM 167]
MPRRSPRKPAENRSRKAIFRLALRHAPTGVFACLGVAVVVNALLMQRVEHPAPLFQTRHAEGQTETATASLRTPSVERIPQHRPEAVNASARQEVAAPAANDTFSSGPDPVVFAVQKALAEAAYGPLEVDGLKGRQTTDALRLFQLDHGLTVNGEIDRETLDRLAAIGAISANP